MGLTDGGTVLLALASRVYGRMCLGAIVLELPLQVCMLGA